MNARQKAKYYKKKYEELVKLYAPTKVDHYFDYVKTLNVDTLVTKRTVPDNKLWNKNVRESVEKQMAEEIINELKRGYDGFMNFETDYDSFKNCHVVEARLRVLRCMN